MKNDVVDRVIDVLTDGRKDDKEKIMMELLPFESLEEVAKVLTFGAKKYAPDNWKSVFNAKSRYTGALLRHLSKHLGGEKTDADSGISHLSHVACNALFLVWFELHEKNNNNG